MEGNIYSDNLTENTSYLNNLGGTESHDEEDPRILVSSYMMYKLAEIIKHFFFPIFIPVGFVENVLSFLVMIQPHNRKMSFSLYMSALAVADTIVVLTDIAVYLEEAHGLDIPPNRHWYCALTMYDYFSSLLCSCYILIIVTFERLYSIIKPHKAASFNTIKRARITIILLYLFCYSYGIPFLFIGASNAISCIPNRYASDNGLGELYYWLTEILSFIFPVISLLIMNSVIIHTLRNRSKLDLSESTCKDDKTEAQNLRIKNPEKQITTTLLLITFVFIILNIPVRSLVFFINFTSGKNTPFYYAGMELFDQIGQKAYFTNHGINFFLYVTSGQKFRTDLKKLFCSKT